MFFFGTPILFDYSLNSVFEIKLLQFKDFEGPGMTNLEIGLKCNEMAKFYSSISIFHLVYNAIFQIIIDA